MLRIKRSPPPRSRLSRVNPLLKMGVALGLMGLALVLRSVPAIALLVGGLLLGLTQVRVRWLVGVYGLWVLTLFTLISAWLLGDWGQALFSTLRLLAVLLPMPVLALTTPPADLLRSLQALRLPGFLTLSLMLIWRFFPLMQQELQRLWEANQLRGVDLRRQPGQWFNGLVVPLIFQMVAYADEVTVGLQTRGYDPAAPRSTLQPLRWGWLDTGFSGLVAIWLVGIVAIAGGR